MQQEIPQYLSEVQVSEITGISLSRLRNDRCQHTGINYYKIGRSVRYRMDEVISWMEARRIEIES